MKYLVRVVLFAALAVLVVLVGIIYLGGQTSRLSSPAAPAGPVATVGPVITPTPVAAGPVCGPSDTRTPGALAFGTHLDPGTLNLSCPASTFPIGSAFAWRATFAQPVTPGDVVVVIARIIGASEQAVLTSKQVVTAPSTASLGAQADAGMLAGLGPGSYMFRAMAGTTVLAEGSFRVVP